MLTVAQAARVYGVSQATVRKWIERGNVSRQSNGLLDIHDLDAWWSRRDTRRVPRMLSQVA